MSARSSFFAGLLVALASSPLQATDAPLALGNAPVQVVRTTDLASDAQAARERNLPILMMFSMDGCGYCELVEQDFLRPMLISGDYRDKVIIRMVKTDSFRDAVLKAVNLGDDADTTAAVCGQIAGAYYGESGLPAEWLQKLCMRDKITEMADKLREQAS